MNALHRALGAFRAAARKLELPLDSEARDDRGRRTRYTSAKAVLDALVPLLEAQGLHVGVVCTDTPQPGKLVLTGVLVHESGCTEPFHEVETFGGTTGLTLAGARTLALSAVYLNLAQVRTEREEVEAEPAAQPVRRAAKQDQTVAARAQGLRAALIHLAQMGVPEAMNWVSWLDRNADPTHAELNRIEKWAAVEMKGAIERHQAAVAKQAQAATEAAPPPGPHLSSSSLGGGPQSTKEPTEGGPRDGDAGGGPEHAGGSLLQAGDPDRAGQEVGATKPHCSLCGASAWHVPDKQRDGRCLIACSFCHDMSATVYITKGKGETRRQTYWCPDCLESEKPKGQRKPIGEQHQPEPASVSLPEALAGVEKVGTGAPGLVEMPPDERAEKVSKLEAMTGAGEESWS